MAQMVKNLSAIQETRVRSLVQEDPLEKTDCGEGSFLSVISFPGAVALPTLAIMGHIQISELQHADPVCEHCWLVMML